MESFILLELRPSLGYFTLRQKSETLHQSPVTRHPTLIISPPHPEVKECYPMGGASDFLLELIVRDLND
ncbi:Lrp/AsnC ligand binding domain-containing protein [Algoriphagus ratkowskyi]|uniref:Uncharacterized protein n=1 Tax=Algoriphagus ratkowskyi TaxID=57028 RepID=A0ABY3HQG9_9BACT|nr:Lrp/AsnC ligand binding domain-containing protein [Algoriphagus ratkowskyi]TXD77900.1 hypothetical protein ESW18_11085 [Algoriphagus ratkowskyi]